MRQIYNGSGVRIETKISISSYFLNLRHKFYISRLKMKRLLRPVEKSRNFLRNILCKVDTVKLILKKKKSEGNCSPHHSAQDLDFSLKAFNGRSDYGPFIAEGVDIPGTSRSSNSGTIVATLVLLPSIAGGLATGADETKTEEERRRFGGVANAILDPCYHQVSTVMS